jgi:hypothetical protein
MARVELAQAAVEDLDRLISTHSLPPDTRERGKHSLRPLETFRTSERRWGAAGKDFGSCSGLGAGWIVYEYSEDEERVVIVTIQDGRSSHAAPAAR